MRRPVHAELYAGDVLIVGAGVTGTLLAFQLLNEGRSVTLMDQTGFGSAQSGHSHGYLHRGYIYRHGEKALIEHLQEGSRRWREVLDAMHIRPVSATSNICFLNELTARAAASAWRESGLAVKPKSSDVPGLRYGQVEAIFETDEETYDFTEFFRAAQNALHPITIRATVRRLERRGDLIQGVLADVGDQLVRIKARLIVLAAGDQNAALAETVTRFSGRAMVRSSLMLVMRHSALPHVSIVLPENEAHGLFVVSRVDGAERIWLASNFVSFADAEVGPVAREGWLRAILQRLALYCTGLRDPDVLWGIYEAPKAELRSQPGALGAHALEDYAIANLLVLAPTKLTLAPLLASQAAQAIEKRLAGRTASYDRQIQGPLLEVCPERWKALALQPRDVFFGPAERASDRRMLLRHVRPRSSFV